MIVMLALTPALCSLSRRSEAKADERGRIVRRFFGISCDWIGRERVEQTTSGPWLFPLLGERVRVREVAYPSFIRGFVEEKAFTAS